MKVKFTNISMPTTGCLVVLVGENSKLFSTGTLINRKVGNCLKKAMKVSKFTAKKGQILEVLAPNGIKASKITMLGIGNPKKLDFLSAESLGGILIDSANKSSVVNLALIVDEIKDLKIDTTHFAAHLALGAKLGSYRYDKFKTKSKAKDKLTIKSISVMLSIPAEARKIYAPMNHLAASIFVTRDLVSEPANYLNPYTFSLRAKEIKIENLKIEVLPPSKLKDLGMNALLGVAQGSTNEPRVVIYKYSGGKKNQKPLAFIGKGVTFDSGGISIKPSQGMEDMKWDMGGAAVVNGLMLALSQRKAKINAVGIVGMVENMPSGSAQRPGDAVTSMSGQTIEVINTDAEGRLVLADILWYTQKVYKPKLMIDLATLTGAIIVALGDLQAGLFSNNDTLANDLINAGKLVGEELCRFPLSESYDKQINSQIADMKNVGGRGAGSITAAQFLQRFVNNVPWAHLDIAGVTWSNSNRPTVPKGGTGYGVRLLDRFVFEKYETDKN